MRCLIRIFLHFIHCCRTLSVITAVVFLCPLLFADTTWVSGDVYGVWDTTGNPYLVTDTIMVPLDSTLRIRPGVEIWFLDQEINLPALIVHGQLLAMGEEGDSIYFMSNEVGQARIDNDQIAGTEIRLEYCVVDSNIRGIKSHGGFMTLLHSSIFAWGDPIWNSEQVDTIQYCYIHDGWIRLVYGSAVFDHNRGDWAILKIDGQQMAPIFANQIRSIKIDGGNATEIYNNELHHALSDYNSSHWYDNQIEDFLSIWGGSPTIEHNVMGEIRLYENYAIIRENVVNGKVRINDCELTFQKNLAVSDHHGIQITGDGVNVIQGNTIVFDDHGIYVIGFAEPNQIINNIFMGDGVNCTGVYSTYQNPLIIRYNDFFQVNAPTYHCELDTGNIFLDPQLRGGDPFDYGLQANSPCIDAGDPTSPLDPDSTRGDMGAYYFDQLIDQPPALISPAVVNVQMGTKLHYTARATDDNGPLHFGFWGLPRWLYRVYPVMDFVENSAYLSGRVPSGQGNFTFGVWVEDGLAQRDSQEVSVLVSSYTILAGEVTGVLTLKESPYMVVEDVVVPAGDSLVIEPGVEIRFQWHPVEDLRHRILVRGTLYAVGTPEDTIFFLPEFGDSLQRAWRGIQCLGNEGDTSRISYAYLCESHLGVVVDSSAHAIIEHTRFDDIRYGVLVSREAWTDVDSCHFSVHHPYFNQFVAVSNATAYITNCLSEYHVPYEYGMHFFGRYGAIGLVQGCTFIGGWGSKAEYGCQLDFIKNRGTLMINGIGISIGSSGIVSNNILSQCERGITVYTYDSTNVLISNNMLYNNGTGIKGFAPSGDTFLENNIFLSNDIGLYQTNNEYPFVNISYNDFWSNDSDYINCLVDSTNMFLDPVVQDTIEFRLTLGSPCIDAGDPDPFFNDPDSTRNDIGCWGGPWGESYPYSPVLSELPKPLPEEFALLPPYPNPFNSVLVIPFTIPTQSEVKITIYNILGQRVDQFDSFPVSPGAHRALWNANAMSSGIYFVKLSSQGKEFIRKTVLLK